MSSPSAAAPESSPSYDARAIEAKWHAAWRQEREGPAAHEDDDAPTPTPTAYVFMPPAGHPVLTLDDLRTTVIADVLARYRRGRGDDVLFSTVLDGDGAIARAQLERLGASLTWSRVPAFAEPAAAAWAQWLFLRLRARNLLEPPTGDGPWRLRAAGYLAENYARLSELDGWSEAARAWQHDGLAPIEGVEVEGQGIDGTRLTVFTEHADRLTGAELVVLSPQHPDLHAWLRTPAAQAELAANPTGLTATGLFLWVPGPDRLLPVAVGQAAHDRIGASALLVIPKASRADAALVDAYVGRTTTNYNYRGKRAKPRRAARLLTADLPITSDHGDVHVPVIHCEDCGPVAAPLDRLPVALDDGCRCPDCGAEARADGQALDATILSALSWLLPLAPEAATPPHALPESTLVAGADAALAVQEMRMVAKALRDLAALPADAPAEPFGRAFVHEPAAPDHDATVAELDAALADAGADALRLAVLHAAAARKPLTWNGEALTHAARLLDRLFAFAAPRIANARTPLGAPRRRDTADLRRLDRWCDVAIDKVTENYEQLDLHRATRNVRMLLDRIEDFDAHHDDGAAVADALLVLVKLLAPLAPHVAEELWERAGQPATAASAPWPPATGRR